MVLIAYDNDPNTELHDFFDSCGCEARQICADYNLQWNTFTPPNLTADNIADSIIDGTICVIAAHGDNKGIYNEAGNDIISLQTTNYNFKGKGLYSISCYCAQDLSPHLLGLGACLFVGYSNELKLRGDITPFVTCVMSGLRSLLSGDNIKTSHNVMLSVYDQQIELLDKTNPIESLLLLHNKESLVVKGDDNLNIHSFN